MKTAIVTGGARGIGKAICEKFISEGYFVFINYKNSKKAAEEMVLKYGGDKCRAFCADVGNRDEVFSEVSKILKEFPKIDVLVNNAGIAGQKLFTDITAEEFREMFRVNVEGIFNFTQAVLPSMISYKNGSIVNISSIWGEVGASCEVHYSASKAAVIGLTKALAKEVAPSGITVNCVAPGIIETDMMFSMTDEEKQELIDETPLGRFGQGEDIARSVFFLAEDTFITGRVLGTNGGFVIV